jgi:hypothetical protein
MHVITQNQEIQIRTERNNLGDVPEIIQSTLDENPCISAAIDTLSKNRLNDKTFLHSKKF